MYWASPLLAKAVTLGLVEARSLGRHAKRVRRRAGDLPTCDLIWAEELVRSRHLTRYQAQALLRSPETDLSTGCVTSEPAGHPLRIGPYFVLDRIGHSDLGATYRCRQLGVREHVAIKLLDPGWHGSEAVESKVASEIEAWTKLGNPHVVAQNRVAQEAGEFALVSRWVTGHSLAAWLRVGRRTSTVTAMALVRELIAALAAADAQGLVHGDLRPSNLLIDARGHVYLSDCGIRRSVVGAGLLSARDLPPDRYDYVAPEVAAGEALLDARSDIYSIGCLLYHLVTGRPPFWGGNAARKCKAHRAGRLQDPQSLGMDLEPEIRLILEATLQADRSRRVHSYNELLNRLSPATPKSSRYRRVALRSGRLGVHSTSSVASPMAQRRATHWAKWLTWAVVTAATVVAVVHGGSRLMPLLSFRVATRSRALGRTNALDSQARGPRLDLTAVTALWNATEDLRTAYRSVEPHGTIVVKSPGPFLLDAIEIAKPITLRGADNVRPLFLGGPGACLRIRASGVQLDNLHFLRCHDQIPGQSQHDARSLVEVSGDRLSVSNCSFQDLSGVGDTAGAIRWHAATHESEGHSAMLEVRNVFFKQVGWGVAVAGPSAAQLVVQESLHLGPGPLISSASSVGRPFEALDVSLSRVTVFGASTAVHSFSHPLDDVLPLRILADHCLFVPPHREQPILAVRYAVQPAMLMPKVSWSGSDTICPADATMLEVSRGPDTSPWRASDITAWNAYWGTHATGLLGARMSFASSPVNLPTDIPRPKGSATTSPGVDPSQLCFPSPVTIEQLPLLMERLRQE